MPAHMKKHLIENTVDITWQGTHYAVPVKVIEKYKVIGKETSLSVADVFSDIIEEYGEAGTLLRGLRNKEGLSQVKFAEAIGISQANLSAIENGRRSIGKILAKRIAEKFGIDYRLLL